jgi:uncharacterized membrane protein
MSDWYYAVNNEQKGPVNESELKTQLAARTLPADTLVWKDGMANWTPASQVPAFTFRAAPAPAAAAVPAGEVVRTTGANNPDSVTPINVASLMTAGALEVEPEDAENNKILGIVAYLNILWLVALLTGKDSPFAKYHANQGLVLFIVEIALIVVLQIIDRILEMLGLSLVSFLFSSISVLVVIGLVILGIINAAAGKCVPLPVIGKFQLIK